MAEPLALPWVQRIHQRLAVRYGSSHTSRYEAIPEQDLWDDWAEQLAGMSAEAIQHGLQQLPDDAAPNAAQFAAICRRSPTRAAMALSPPDAKANPELVARIKAAINPTCSGAGLAIALAEKEAWQDEHPRDVSRYQRLTLAQRQFWRQALRVPDSMRAGEALERLRG
jgi:hypothetical protein